MVTIQKIITIKRNSLLKTLKPTWIIIFALLCFYQNLGGNFKINLVSIQTFTHTHSTEREREEASQNLKPYTYMW